MLVTVYICERCGLKFVADEPPTQCAACLRHHSGPVTIRLYGQRVEVASVRLYGENPLRRVRGLESLRLGCRCPHNWLIWYLCPECSVQP